MSTGRVLAGLVGGGIIGGAVSAGCGAASGAIGAAVLNSSYGGYDVLLATQMTASGAALLGGASGAITGAIAGCSDNSVKTEVNHTKTGLGLLGFVGGMTISGLVGYGLFLSTATSTLALNVGQVAASAAAGSAIFGGGLAVVTTVGLLCCIGAAMEDKPEVAMEEGHAATAPRLT